MGISWPSRTSQESMATKHASGPEQPVARPPSAEQPVARPPSAWTGVGDQGRLPLRAGHVPILSPGQYRFLRYALDLAEQLEPNGGGAREAGASIGDAP